MSDDIFNFDRRDLLKAIALTLLVLSRPGIAAAQSAVGKLKIGVIGAGHIGSTIGGLWIKAGHTVYFSSRHPEEIKPSVESMGPRAKAGTVERGARFRRRNPLAVPYKAIPELAKEYGPKFAGKIVIDPANAVARRDGEELLKETKEKGIGNTTTLSQGRACRARIQLDELHKLRERSPSRRRSDGNSDRGR